MTKYLLILTFFAFFASACAEPTPDLTPDAWMLDDAAMGDAGPADDAAMSDARPPDDAVMANPDAGTDAAIVPDAGTDAGPVDACPSGTLHDAPLGICISRHRWISGPHCPGSLTPLEWRTVEDQRRLGALLAGESGGTGLGFGHSRRWSFVLGSGLEPDAIEWDVGHPAFTEASTYLYRGKLRTYHQPRAWQYCTRPE